MLCSRWPSNSGGREEVMPVLRPLKNTEVVERGSLFVCLGVEDKGIDDYILYIICILYQ